ncbi:serine/threonine protein kinase [Methylocaldum sp. BRCS4]|nr:serine/threonine protein kinase [Methylocaldum sp. BRCS4]
MPQNMRQNALNPGYRLQWFSIEQVLGQGNFGITYLAHDSILERHVAIKEYLPVKLAVRDGAALIRPATEDCGEQYLAGLELFINEARMLAKVEHPNIVRVLNVFVANNSAYMVMSYEEGESLHAVLERRRTLEQGELLRFLIPILNGLEKIHNAGFIHCDITPANILLRKDGSPVLLDFGSARQSLGEKTQALPSMLSPGYAAIEQYYGKGDQLGPWTDIYGLGATLYRSIAGIAPPDALERSQSIILASKEIFVSAKQVGGPRYSEGLLRAVDHALSLNPPKRPQSIAAWRREFSLAPELPVEDAPAPKQPEVKAETVVANPADAPARRPTSDAARSRIPAISAIVLIVAAGLVWLNRGLFSEREQATASSDAEQTVRENDPAGIDQSAETVPQEIAPATPPSPPEESTVEKNAGAQAGSEQHAAEIDALFELLARAGEDIRAGRLISPKDNNALAKYRSVLALDPNQPQAKQGIQEIVDRFAQPAREAMDRRDWKLAQTRIDEVAIVLPEAESLRQELDTRRAEAEKGRSKASAEQKSAEQTAAISPDHKQAAQSPSAPKTPEAQGDAEISDAEESDRRKQAAGRTVGRAWRALNREEWDKAQVYIDQAAATLGDTEEVQTLRRQLISRKAQAAQAKETTAEGAQATNAGAAEQPAPVADKTAVKIESARSAPHQVSPGERVEFITTYELTLPAGTRDAEVELGWVLKAGGRQIGQEGSDFKLARTGTNTATNELTVPSYMKSGTYTVEHRVRAGDSRAVARSHFSVVRKPRQRSDEAAPSDAQQGE